MKAPLSPPTWPWKGVGNHDAKAGRNSTFLTKCSLGRLLQWAQFPDGLQRQCCAVFLSLATLIASHTSMCQRGGFSFCSVLQSCLGCTLPNEATERSRGSVQCHGSRPRAGVCCAAEELSSACEMELILLRFMKDTS